MERALKDRVMLTETEFISTRSTDAARIWKRAQEEPDAHLLESASNKRFFLQQKYFEEGERAGHMLATIARAQLGSSYITNLKGVDGVTVSDTEDIMQIMSRFYENLYSTKLAVTPSCIATYLEDISLPSLSPEQREYLDAPIQLEELQLAVSSLANNKAPGVDGLPNEVYAKLDEVLLPHLLQVFRASAIQNQLPDSMQEAVIIVLPKPGKDPMLPESYRPISLLPVDAKILAKVLATRLSRVISSLIHPDQTGFIPGKSTAINLRRLYLNLQIPSDYQGS